MDSGCRGSSHIAAVGPPGPGILVGAVEGLDGEDSLQPFAAVADEDLGRCSAPKQIIYQIFDKSGSMKNNHQTGRKKSFNHQDKLSIITKKIQIREETDRQRQLDYPTNTYT